MPEPLSFVESRAVLTALWDRVHPNPDLVVEFLADAPLPPGWAAWRVVGEDGASSTVALPALDPQAPFEIHRRYLARVVATATGRCPECGAVAGVSRDPDDGPAAWRLLPVVVTVQHSGGCPATFGESERCWFPLARS